MFTKIEFKHHVFVFSFATTLWTLVFLGGLSSTYYQTWPFFKTLIIIDIIPGVSLIPIGYYFLKFIIGHDVMIASIWCSFYASVPLAFYDNLYLSTQSNFGMISYIENYWYLSFFHLVPWIVLPIVAYILSKQRC